MLRDQLGAAARHDHRGLVGVAPRRDTVGHDRHQVTAVGRDAEGVLVLPHHAVVGVGESTDTGGAELGDVRPCVAQRDAVQHGVAAVPGPFGGSRSHAGRRATRVADHERREGPRPPSAAGPEGGCTVRGTVPTASHHQDEDHDDDHEDHAAEAGEDRQQGQGDVDRSA